MGVLSGVSIAHSDADVAQIEGAAAQSQRAALGELIGEPLVEEAFVLQTCNRVEAYVVTEEATQGRRVLAKYFTDADTDVCRTLDHEDSLRHLMRVAAGLESLVLGEDQIIGQVRDAYQDARAVGAIGTVLENAVPKAIRVGERARTETAINEGVVSLGSAAVELARDECALDGETAVVVGAGEMATLTAKALGNRTGVDRLLVANRTIPHAEHVVDSVDTDGSAIGLDALPAAVETATVVVTATGSPETVLGPEDLAGAGETVVVDLAQPHDVDTAAADLDSVAAYDLDDLETVTSETRERRQDAALAVEDHIDTAFEELLTQYKRERADEVISAMYESAERLKAAQLDRALSKMDLDDEQRQVVESMADSIVNQLLAPPTTSLRDAAEEDDWSTINTALQLFDPDFSGEDVPETFVGELGPEDLPDGMPDNFVGDHGMPDEIPEAAREQMPAAVLDKLED